MLFCRQMKLLARLVVSATELTIFGCLCFAQVQVTSQSGIHVVLDGGAKSFQISSSRPHWTFGGSVDGTVSGEHALKGKDRIGRFEEIVFISTSEISYRCSIRTYDQRPVVLFKQEALDSLRRSPKAFPILSKFPEQLSLMTFSEHEFGSPPIFRRFDTHPDGAFSSHSGPLLLYDSLYDACIISPALNFMVASTTEIGTSVYCGLNADLAGISRGFTESTILVVENGINRAWNTWGTVLTDLNQKEMPANDADVGLKYLGYWTDNGATYYYRYDTSKGYDGTLLALKRRYEEEHIPIRYMQLDSWWYSKGYDNPDGSADRTERRIQDLPVGNWNRFGGLLEYVPPAELFPGGLEQFHDSLRLPLITHNRWISRDSPYRSRFKISGIGAIDRRWWNDIMKSIFTWGVATYEQDWLDRIYFNSPEFSSTTWASEEFMNAMASATRGQGLTMQYCMALPRHYLQGGAKYSNLTTIRVSGDRFQESRWKEFLYGSRLASALGIWPWSDVFMSVETPNILLATLSAGMVGIGDKIGDENISNISKSVRSDGVIVKPDVPLVPIDKSYVSDASGKGIRIATTYSDHGKSLKIFYLFAYADSASCKGTIVSASDIGISKKTFMYDCFAGTGKIIQSGDSLNLSFTHDGYFYGILAPIGRSGIAVIGDPGKFVACGKKRISQLVESDGKLKATILLAKGEQSVSVCGYAPKMPQFSIHGGHATAGKFDPANHIFRIEMKPQENLQYVIENGDAVGKISVEFKAPS
jgi:hypothetical protein